MSNSNRNILFAAIFGILLGIVLKNFQDFVGYEHLVTFIDMVGQLFIKALKMILVPLVFFSIVVGISNLGSGKKSSKIWKSSLIYYFSTMAIAVIIALSMMNLVNPGQDLQIDAWTENLTTSPQTLTIFEFLQEFLLSLFANPFESLTSGNILSIIIFFNLHWYCLQFEK